ncbi:MAG: exonuclease domain-containing protein [Lewinella sp.]|nr:exonuclease domain-containing protein [Lewinella sp.]
MNFIIFDLEATCWEGRPPSMTMETIEIGALKVNAYGEVVGQFQRFVKPTLHPLLSHFCQQLTGINQQDINRASTFPSVIEDFQEWIDIWDEDYLLCAWGGFDQKQLQRDALLHDLEDDWLDPYINLKQQYRVLKRLHRPRGLRNAVEKEGFEFTGDQHRALADADNLTKLFRKYLDVWMY